MTDSGGVRLPTIRVISRAMPKWSGVRPTDTAMGNRMGVVRMMIQTVSMNLPRIISSRKMKARIRNLESVMLISQLANIWGTF